MAAEILTKIAKDGLDIKNARGQSYDNGVNMSGIHKGVQARIIKENEFARFIRCLAHCLNLCGEKAATSSSCMVTFFSNIQQLLNFFSRSVNRWKVLMSILKIALKGYSSTRWSSKAKAVKSVVTQIIGVCEALAKISQNSTDKEAIFTAKNLLKQVNFEFLLCLEYWNLILNNTDRVNTLLQSKSMCLSQALELLKA